MKITATGALTAGLVLSVAAMSACTVQPTETTGSGGDPSAAATSASAAAGDGGVIAVKDGKGAKVALVPGGAHPYFQPWKVGGQTALSEYGVGGITFNETGEWDQGKQNAALDSLAAQGYNAFAIFGVSPSDINTTFGDLKDKGYAVGSLASCPAGNTNEADWCLSTDTELAAYKAATAAIEAMGGKGNLVHLTGNNVDSNTQRRIKGVKKAIDETGGKVKLFQTVTDIDTDLQTAQKAVTDLVNANGKQIQGMVSTAYNPAVASAEAVKKAGLPIKIVAIDDDPKILAGIKDGSVTATIAQNPEGQGFLGVWLLTLLESKQCTMTKPGVVVDSGSFVVNSKNVASYDTERKAETEKLQLKFSTELLTCS
jgi:ribose transport system substrate-binding protein